MQESLARQRLGVSVQGGSATLWGSVASTELRRRAEETLRRMTGIHQVLNKLRIEPNHDDLQAASLLQGRQSCPPKPPDASAPLPAVQADRRMTGPPVELASEGGDAPSSLPARQPEASASHKPAAAILPRLTALPSQDVATLIEALRQKNERLNHIRTEVRDCVVYLRGTVGQFEALIVFAREVARLHGVERVVLENIMPQTGR